MFAGELDLKDWYKPNFDKKFLKELSKRSDLKGIIDVFIFLLALYSSLRIDLKFFRPSTLDLIFELLFINN